MRHDNELIKEALKRESWIVRMIAHRRFETCVWGVVFMLILFLTGVDHI